MRCDCEFLRGPVTARPAAKRPCLEARPAPCAEPACLAGGLPVFLVGMMGAGKTTIGRGLARALGREFVDLDHELEARCGVRVPVIFEIEGEAGFRRREASALQECTQRRGIVLATGGGAILAPDNRRLLRERGLVVYLRASVDELFRRTSRDRNRPLLATADPRGSAARPDDRARAFLHRGGPSRHRDRRRAGEQRGQDPAEQAANLRDFPMTAIVDVDTPGGRYPIHLGPGRLDALDASVPADATAIAWSPTPRWARCTPSAPAPP